MKNKKNYYDPERDVFYIEALESVYKEFPELDGLPLMKSKKKYFTPEFFLSLAYFVSLSFFIFCFFLFIKSPSGSFFFLLMFSLIFMSILAMVIRLSVSTKNYDTINTLRCFSLDASH